jgi:hypothetical protein
VANKATKFADEVTAKFTRLGRQVVNKLQDELQDASPNDVHDIVMGVWKEYDVPEELQSFMLDAVEGATKVSVDLSSPIGFRKNFLNSETVDGVKMSDKIYDVAKAQNIISDIRQSVQVADKWSALADNLVEQGAVKGSLPKYINDLLEKGRQAANLTEDREAYAKYRRSVSAVKRRIDGLADSDTSKLAQSYRDIASLSVDASDEVVGATVERAVMQTARANAVRLARTEVARSYANGAMYAIQNDNDAVGVRVSLSAIHEGYCICDFFVETDMYGMGPGIFPKDELPEFPFHPHCMCLLDPWYKGETGEYDDEAGSDAFDDLEEDEQKALAGKDGDWEDVDWKDHTLPKGFEEVVE